MKRQFSRVTSLVLLAATAASLASCGEAGSSESTTEASTTTQTLETEPAFPTLDESLDFGGETLTVLVREDDGSGSVLWKNEFAVEEESGDVLCDAVYNRNLKVEDYLNIDIVYKKLAGDWGNKDSFLSNVRTSIMASDGLYDTIGSYQYYTPTLVVEGLYKNLYDFPYIDYSQPWWPDAMLDEIALGDKLYFITGSISLSSYRDMIVTFFNKSIAEDFGIKPYELVKNGEWTIDKAIELSSLVKGDLNGDGQYTVEDDRYGYMNYSVGEYFVSFGTRPSAKNDAGIPEYRLSDERYAEAIDKLQEFLFSGDGTVSYVQSSAYTDRNKMFMEDRVLFFTTGLMFSDEFRSMSSDFGIIPIFKYDEAQEKHYTRLADAYTVFGVPIDTTKSDEMLGAFLEAMATEGYKSISPVYYSTVLKDKVSRDEESIEMLEMIQSNLVYTFDYLYSSVLGDVGAIIRKPLQDTTVRYASYLASNLPSWQKQLDNLIETLGELE